MNQGLGRQFESPHNAEEMREFISKFMDRKRASSERIEIADEVHSSFRPVADEYIQALRDFSNEDGLGENRKREIGILISVAEAIQSEFYKPHRVKELCKSMCEEGKDEQVRLYAYFLGENFPDPDIQQFSNEMLDWYTEQETRGLLGGIRHVNAGLLELARLAPIKDYPRALAVVENSSEPLAKRVRTFRALLPYVSTNFEDISGAYQTLKAAFEAGDDPEAQFRDTLERTVDEVYELMNSVHAHKDDSVKLQLIGAQLLQDNKTVSFRLLLDFLEQFHSSSPGVLRYVEQGKRSIKLLEEDIS